MFLIKKDLATESALLSPHHGEVRHTFFAPEFVQYSRSPVWYLVAGVISLGIIIVSLLAGALLFALAYLTFVAVYFLIHRLESGMVEVTFKQHGVQIGNDFFPYAEIKAFWLIWKPPFVAELKLRIARHYLPTITIHAFGQDPLALRALLAPHVPEDTSRQETFIDLLTRALKL